MRTRLDALSEQADFVVFSGKYLKWKGGKSSIKRKKILCFSLKWQETRDPVLQ